MPYRSPSGYRIQSLAAALYALAAELERADIRHTFQGIATAADNTHSAKTSTIPPEPNNHVDENGNPTPPTSTTEANALTTDRVTHESRQALTAFTQLETTARHLLAILITWRPDRTIQQCGRCGHPLPRGTTRCQRINPDTGQLCAASPIKERCCRICDKVMPPGEPLRAGRCNACRMFRERNGRDKITRRRLDYYVTGGL